MYAIMDEDGEVIGNEYATEAAAQRDLDFRVQDDAEAFGEWAIFDEDDNVSDSGYVNERSAQFAADSRACEDARDSVRSMSIEDMRSAHDMPAKEESSNHLGDRLDGGVAYEEHVISVPQEVLKRGGVERPGIDAHFRDDVDNVLGWNLMEQYEDIPTGGKVRMIHENQSDWGQEGVEHGFAKATPEEIAAAKKAYQDADEAWQQARRSEFVEMPRGGGVARVLDEDPKSAREIGAYLSNMKEAAEDLAM